MKHLGIPIVLLFLSGCSWLEDNYGAINLISKAEGVPEEFQCIQNYFPIKFNDFDADQPFSGYTRIRLFESIYQTMETHFLSIEFIAEDPETLEKCPKPEANHTYELTRSGCVRAALQLNGYETPTMFDKWAESSKNVSESEKKCEDAYTVYLTGSLELGDLSFKRDKRISGKFNGEMALYWRIENNDDTFAEKCIPLGDIEGSFSFVNHVGAAWDN